MTQLVLSLFPGIGLLDRAFEEEGFCVVRGPDLLWGGDHRRFRIMAGRFDGIIGGPPCQFATALKNFKPASVDRYGNMVPEYERTVREGQPAWFLMENVRQAPIPKVQSYRVHSQLLNNRHLGEEQNRVRRFSFGTHDGRPLHLETAALSAFNWKAAVTAAHSGERRSHFNSRTGGRIQRYTVEEALEAQGWPADFFGERSPFKREMQLKMIANGVPRVMALAVARAVKKAINTEACAA